ncbi:MAG: hypothetical protein WAT79_08685 [Saprospiraceae bacterium]
MTPLLGSQSVLDIINNWGRKPEDNIDLNVGGKPQERFMLMRHDELPEFTEEEAGAIKNLMSNRKDKPSDKLGTVLHLGTGEDPSGLHAARTIFMDDKKDPSDYIVAYDPVREGGFSLSICGTERKFDMVVPSSIDWDIPIKQVNLFSKIEGPGTVLWKRKHNMAKNRLRKYITKSFYKRYKLI